MTTTYKVLGQSNPAATTLTTLYAVPASTSAIASTIVIANLGVSTTVRVAVRPGGAAIDNKHYLVHDGLLNQYDTISISIGMTLSATDVVSVYAGTATVAFNLFGAEITA